MAGAPLKRTWRVAGMGESHVDHALRGLVDGIADATLHFRIAYPENLVTVVVRRDDGRGGALLDALDAEVRARLGDARVRDGRDDARGGRRRSGSSSARRRSPSPSRAPAAWSASW